MKSDLVVFGEDWGRHPSSTQHLIGRLATDRQVLWINSIGMRRPRLSFADLKRAARKIMPARQVIPRPQTAHAAAAETSTSVRQLSPLVVPWPGSRVAFTLNHCLLSHQVTRAMQATAITRPILWTSLPTALPVVGSLGERAVVYYCGDDFGSLVGVDHEPVLELEERLVEKADLVLAASEILAARFPKHKTLHVSHGVDAELFGNPVPRATDLPSGRLIAGFYGSISSWIDVELLAAAADGLPDWDFVLIGAVETDVSRLRERPNIRLLGRKPHTELPRYSQHWTVSLLPFRDTPQIRACNPLKLREYLAAGRPVVATEFPALAPYRDIVAIATDQKTFIACIQDAATEGDRTSERRSRVSGETWAARADLIERSIACL